MTPGNEDGRPGQSGHHQRVGETESHRTACGLPRVDYAVDPAVVTAWSTAAGAVSTLILAVYNATHYAADAVRATGGDDQDVAAALDALRQRVTSAADVATALETGGP